MATYVTEAAVRAARDALCHGGEEPYMVHKAYCDRVAEALEAAAPHIGGEAVRQAVGETRYQHVRQGSVNHDYVRALDDVLKHAEGER